jgi:uncharacterized membrane protein
MRKDREQSLQQLVERSQLNTYYRIPIELLSTFLSFEILFGMFALVYRQMLKRDRAESHQRALAQARELSELKLQFFSMVSHEFRTPLSIILVTFNAETGLSVARGGGLLFFTNLVAITFMAMLVFLALNIDSDPVRDLVRTWREEDRESIWVQSLLDKMPASGQLKRIGGLRSRLLLIVMTILVISIPLNQSYSQLRSEIAYKQQQNQLRSAATEIWQKNFAEFTDGKARSYISQLSFQERDRQLVNQLQVVTSTVYSEAERLRYKQLLSTKLQRSLDSIGSKLSSD